MLNNNGMRLVLMSQLGDVSVLYRLGTDDYVVVNCLNYYDNDKCDWAFAYQYDIEDYKDAMKLAKKVARV